MKEELKAMTGVIGIVSLLALAVFTRTCGPKVPSLGAIKPTVPERENTTTKVVKSKTKLPSGVTNTTVTTEITKTVEVRKDNKAGVNVICEVKSISNVCASPVYGVTYERRLMDTPVFLGAGINSAGGVSLSTSVEF